MTVSARTPKLILCPGQGAQVVGMGKAWFEGSPEAKAVFKRADEVLGNRLGAPLSSICFEGPVDRLNKTDVSQPAIYVTSVACWHGLLAKWAAGEGLANGVSGGGAIESHVLATAGLSLGEYTALHIAGVFSFEDGLELVTLRGRAMQEAADQIKLADGSIGSGMVALIGADEGQAAEVCADTLKALGDSAQVLVPANYNCPGQIVISGSILACQKSVEVASGKSLRAQALSVAGAFHSPLMRPAADRLREALEKTTIRAPRCPVMSNVTGKAHDGGQTGTIEASIRARLVEQLTSPVRWEQDCRELMARAGSRAGGLCEWHELAPGKSLAGMMRRIDKAVKVETHDEP